MLLLLVITTLLLPGAADSNWADLHQKFTDFKAEFNFDFGEDDAKREAIFHDNVRYINKVNAQNLPYRLGINKFAHLTHEEFKDMMGFGGTNSATRPFTFEGEADDELPMKVDWRDKGYVTPVKDQKQCGSCWAFSATGALEALHKNMTGNLVSLSEQELVDCSGSYGNKGCNGGWTEYAFEYVKNNGIESEGSYPYKGKDRKCHSDTTKAEIKNGTVGVRHIEAGSEISLQAAVANYGPVSVGIEADKKVFQYYKEGIITGTDCGTDIDHAVLVVGFVRVNSSSKDTPYFIVKNSWGSKWGEEGYVRIMSNGTGDGICGILGAPTMPKRR